MIFTKQLAEAEKVIVQAEAKLPKPQAPMTLALCCEKMARAYNAADNSSETKKWNDAAKTWYEKAQADHPEDLSIKRRLAEFFLRSKQINAATDCLNAIRNQEGGGAKNTETARWANRMLALVLANGTDRTQMSRALALFEPDGKPVPPGQEGKNNLPDPEDQRYLAQVLDRAKDPCTLQKSD